MADVRLSRVCRKINYLVYLNAVVILGRPGSSTIDCPQGRLFCFGAKAGWIDIWWSVESGAGPASASQCCVSGDESQASGRITCCLLTSVRGSGARSWRYLRSPTWAGSSRWKLTPDCWLRALTLCVSVCVCVFISPCVHIHVCLCSITDTGLSWASTLSIHIDSSSTTGCSCFICMAQLTQAVSGHYIPIS